MENICVNRWDSIHCRRGIVASASVQHRAAYRHHGTTAFVNEFYQQCSFAHLAAEDLGPVPTVIAKAWGRAFSKRIAEALQPVTLQCTNGSRTDSCHLTLVGIAHRDVTNLRFVHVAVESAAPDAIALEARHSFLPTYRELAGGIPTDLLLKLLATPLHDLQDAFDHVDLDDRLAWHRALVDGNARLATAATLAATEAANELSGRRPPSSSSSLTPSRAPPSPSSTVSPPKLLSAFLARELLLSESVAVAVAASRLGVPLHGIDLDDPTEYQALLEGPLLPQYRQQQQQQQRHHQHHRDIGADELEAEQRRLGLRHLEPEVATAFREWFRSAPGGPMGQLLQSHLAGLMQNCMDPESYMSYVDETDELWADEQRVGPALVAQHKQLTGLRETHFLKRLQWVTAAGGSRRSPCKRLMAVMGRTHAARLRRTLQQQQQAPKEPPPPQ